MNKGAVTLLWGIKAYESCPCFKWRQHRRGGRRGGRSTLVPHPSIPVCHFNVHIMTSRPSLCYGPSTIIIVKWFIDWCCQHCYCQEKLISEKENRASNEYINYQWQVTTPGCLHLFCSGFFCQGEQGTNTINSKSRAVLEKELPSVFS